MYPPGVLFYVRGYGVSWESVRGLLPQGGVHNNGTGLGQLQIVLEPGGRHLLPQLAAISRYFSSSSSSVIVMPS